MNPPKFRGYSLETKSWHYGHGWYEVDYTDEYKQEKGITDKAMLYREHDTPIECELASMGQLTGEIVRNKEIYDGDIIKVNQLSFDSSGPLPDILNVRYYGGMFQMFRGDKSLFGLHLLYLKDGEIIGNTFEHAHLMTEKTV